MALTLTNEHLFWDAILDSKKNECEEIQACKIKKEFSDSCDETEEKHSIQNSAVGCCDLIISQDWSSKEDEVGEILMKEEIKEEELDDERSLTDGILQKGRENSHHKKKMFGDIPSKEEIKEEELEDEISLHDQAEKKLNSQWKNSANATSDPVVQNCLQEKPQGPFKCSLCSYQAKLLGSLKKHERTHADERPFKCKSCSYRATLLGNLKRHEKTHTVKDAKKKWTCLSDCYRKALNRKKTASGQKAVNITPWKYENQKSFLKSHLNKKRPQISNLVSMAETGMGNENLGEGTREDGTSQGLEESTTHELSAFEVEDSLVLGEEQLSCQELATPPTAKTAANKKKASHETSAHEILKAYFENKKSKADHLTSFFKGVEDTVRTFSPLLQIEIKSRISSLVSEFEYKNLTDSTSFHLGTM